MGLLDRLRSKPRADDQGRVLPRQRKFAATREERKEVKRHAARAELDAAGH